jgi:hypothetical protein
MSYPVCEMCNRDLCDDCIEHEIDWGGDDMISYYCKTCWTTIGKSYRESINYHKEQIEKLKQEWEQKCLNESRKGSIKEM